MGTGGSWLDVSEADFSPLRWTVVSHFSFNLTCRRGIPNWGLGENRPGSPPACAPWMVSGAWQCRSSWPQPVCNDSEVIGTSGKLGCDAVRSEPRASSWAFLHPGTRGRCHDRKPRERLFALNPLPHPGESPAACAGRATVLRGCSRAGRAERKGSRSRARAGAPSPAPDLCPAESSRTSIPQPSALPGGPELLPALPPGLGPGPVVRVTVYRTASPGLPSVPCAEYLTVRWQEAWAKVPRQEEAGIWLDRLGGGRRLLPLRAFPGALPEGERACVCESACRRRAPASHLPGGGGEWVGGGGAGSGGRLLLGEGELQGLSCQVAGSICQLFAHCLPIGDLLQALKWTCSLETSSFLGAAIT